MINIPLDEITKTDIDALVTNQTAETKTLEYKEALPKTTEGQIKEFLADVSSFANATGGDIIYGIKEKREKSGKKTGTPEDAIGIVGITTDDAKLRLENIIRDGLSPRLKVQIRCIDGFTKGPVIILRIPQSFSAPHMICKGESRFYSRNSAGKYPLDVGEIRSLFLASESLPEKIKRFREQRLAEIVADQTPVELSSRRRFIIHLTPISAFLYKSNNPDVTQFSTDDMRRVQQAVLASYYRYNIDGYLGYSGNKDGKRNLYFQIYRNGIIEYVDCNLLTSQVSPDVIPSIAYETRIIEIVSKYLTLMKYLNIETPILIMINLIDVKGVKMGVDPFYTFEDPQPIDRDSVIIPDVLVEDYADKPDRILRTVFDSIWQACGSPSSPNYDENGNWRAWRR
jgi:hypothetical protein